jgi:hypothetical protein
LARFSPALTILIIISSLPPLFFYLNIAFLTIYNKTKTLTPFLFQSSLITSTTLFNMVSTILTRRVLLW